MRTALFLILAVLFTVLMVVVPFLVFTDFPRFEGAFLFWTLVPLATVIFAVAYTRSWGRQDAGDRGEKKS